MNLPYTYAGGTFNLPLRVAKMVRLAEQAAAQERNTARRLLWKLGWFLDRVGIVWEKDEVPEIARDDLYRELAS